MRPFPQIYGCDGPQSCLYCHEVVSWDNLTTFPGCVIINEQTLSPRETQTGLILVPSEESSQYLVPLFYHSPLSGYNVTAFPLPSFNHFSDPGAGDTCIPGDSSVQREREGYFWCPQWMNPRSGHSEMHLQTLLLNGVLRVGANGF